MITRRKTRQIKVGGLKIGGNAPVSIQSMTKTDTRDAARTIRQIKELEKLGCEIIRVAVKDIEAAKAIKKIKNKIKIPLVADIHFHYNLAIEAINSGADKIRLNPGNIKNRNDIIKVVELAKRKRVPMRIGINSGSVGSRPMVRAALDYIKIFESLDFRDIIISLKASDVMETIGAYRKMAGLCDYPFHLGVTAAGPSESGIIKSSIGIGALLAEGIGDTIRVSLTGLPHDEVRVAKEILSSLGLRRFGGIDIVSCPTCGRCEVDLINIVKEFEKKALSMNHPSGPGIFSNGPRDYSHRLCKQIRVAIMGCVVNGPGEAKEADIGLAAGKKSGILFKNGKIIGKVKEADFVSTLLSELKKL